jgi:hypothetical protein
MEESCSIDIRKVEKDEKISGGWSADNFNIFH